MYTRLSLVHFLLCSQIIASEQSIHTVASEHEGVDTLLTSASQLLVLRLSMPAHALAKIYISTTQAHKLVRLKLCVWRQ